MGDDTMGTNYELLEEQTTLSNRTAFMMQVDFNEWSDNLLLTLFDVWQQEQAKVSGILGRMEQALIQRMTQRQATAIPSEQFVCELKVTDTYDQVSFGPLKEVFNEADLAGCFTPAHEETVEIPDKWATTKVKALARRYGAEALAVVERARILGAPRLSFKLKEE